MIFLPPERPHTASHEIGGALFHYRSRGEGEPVLLLHGIPGDLRSLSPVADRLATEAEKITVSLPVPPPGARPARPFGTEAQRDDLVDVIWSLERGPMHLVAWSYACHAALAVAIMRPDLVRSLCLYEPGFPTFVTEVGARRDVQADMMAGFGPVAEMLARGDRDDALRHAIDWAAGRRGHFDTQPEPVRTVHRGTAHMLEALFLQTPPLPLSPADLATIRCPVTVARGSATRTCYRIVTDRAAQCIPQADHVVVDGSTHLLPEQCPQLFSALVDGHLARVRGAASRSTTQAEDAA